MSVRCVRATAGRCRRGRIEHQEKELQMRVSFLFRSLALLCLSAVYSAGSALAETEAEDKAFSREIRPVEKTGCKEYWSSDDARSIERVIKACTRALERTNWSDVQRAYAYHVRGAASAVADKLPEALSNLDQAITINPSYAPSYYERGYVHMRLEHPALSHADFQKSVDLGDKEAEYPLKIARDTCPSLIWEGKTCVSAGAPVPPALAVEAPAPPTTGPAIDDPPRLIVADAPTTPPPAVPAGQGQRLVIGPSSMFPGLASPEMLPTLRAGDEIEIIPYTGSPNSGDIVALKLPIDGKTIVARRVIGLPGDEIDSRAGVVLLNGIALPRVRVNTDGSVTSYRETLPNGTQYVVLDQGATGTNPDLSPFSMRAPAGHYFVLGDNRDVSLDVVHVWGYGHVPAEDIVGRVQKIAAPAPSASPPPVAATPNAEPSPHAEKPSWFSWLWGSKKPAAEPAPPGSNVTAASPPKAEEPTPPQPQPGPTTTVQYAGKDIVLEAPSGACFVPTDNELLTLFFKKVAQPSTNQRWRILAGYQDCDTPLNDFRALIGTFAVVEDMQYDGPQREAAARDLPFELCKNFGARTDLAIERLDEVVTGKLAEAASSANANPDSFRMEPIVVGMSGPVCTTVSAWAMSKKGAYMMFTLGFALKSRFIVLTASSSYSGPESANAAYRQALDMIWHMGSANYVQ